MRTNAQRIATGAAGAVLALLLAACGGGSDQAGATASSSSADSGKQTTPAVAAPKAVPAGRVCDKFSKEDVSRATGVTFVSANDTYLSGGSPTTCFYYTDSSEIDYAGIQWMTLKDALWENQVDTTKNSPNPSPADMETVHTRVKGVGDDAVKEVVTNEGKKTIGYYVLHDGIVLYISTTDAAKVSDAALVNLAKMVIDKL